MPNNLKLLLFVAALGAANLGLAQTFSSGQKQNTFVELYTSEGCSSCPPADTWLRNLKNHPDLWGRLIPVGFHVDYWDWIGWKDQFAQATFGDRQKLYKTKRKTRSVYTPGFFINGSEWRGFFERRTILPPVTEQIAGKLVANVNTKAIIIDFKPAGEFVNAKKLKLNAYIALLSFGKENAIKSGENSGRSLQHDFIVEALNAREMKITDSSYQITMPNSYHAVVKPETRYGLAVWVANRSNLNVIQATGGWLNSP